MVSVHKAILDLDVILEILWLDLQTSCETSEESREFIVYVEQV